jgi:hypothetical protein
VIERNRSLISVGFTNTDFLIHPFVQLYLTGSNNGRDNVSVLYWTDVGGTGHVTFTAQTDSARFDRTGTQATTNCNYNSDTEVICDLPRPLDTITLAGMSGDDSFNLSGFPATTSVAELGGDGRDSLGGSNGGPHGFTEDMLVDGPNTWADNLSGGLRAFGGDDVLINNEGTDALDGGNGNDLLLSAVVCNGDSLTGASSVDNASWAQMPAPTRVVADTIVGKAGDGSGPVCSGPGTLTNLASIEDLEGSSQNDGLFTGGAVNSLLGRLGQDNFSAGANNDRVDARDGVFDTAIDCGADFDSFSRDPGTGDPQPQNCEQPF